MTDWAALHARGLTAAEAAKEAGKSRQAAYLWAWANKVTWRTTKPCGSHNRPIDWTPLYNQGLTARQAARAAGAHYSSARKWAKKNGLEWVRERLPAKGRPADTSGLTPEQQRDFETLVRLGGYTQADALAAVTRPKIKVRAPSCVPSALPRSGA